jgi:hypothetical protein
VRLGNQPDQNYTGLPHVDRALANLLVAVWTSAIARGDERPAVRAHSALIHAGAILARAFVVTD